MHVEVHILRIPDAFEKKTQIAASFEDPQILINAAAQVLQKKQMKYFNGLADVPHTFPVIATCDDFKEYIALNSAQWAEI